MTKHAPGPQQSILPLKKLGDVTTPCFLADYWQQQPLLARQVFALGSGFAPLSDKEILQLAAYDEARSRLVVAAGKNWTMEHGPFSARKFSTLKKSAAAGRANWTVLVQDTQHFSREAHDLLRRFSFLPYSRIDDLMVSLASKGGGVGPHIDSYDVFLLQGSGRRRWQISSQTDHSLRPDVPLNILKNFKCEHEWVLEEGDLLYLPPGVAHNGIAESDNCVTWSIGFRAPTYQELIDAYLDHLRDNLTVVGRYADRQRTTVTHPAFISAKLRSDWSTAVSAGVRSALNRETITAFVGGYLTQPKSHVEFMAAERIPTAATFCGLALKYGIRLDLRSIMLFDETHFYLNGRALEFDAALNQKQRKNLKQLADNRFVGGPHLDHRLPPLLYDCVVNGEIEIAE